MIDKKTGNISIGEDIVFTKDTRKDDLIKEPYINYVSEDSKNRMKNEKSVDVIILKPVSYLNVEYIIILGFSVKGEICDAKIQCFDAGNLYAIDWKDETIAKLVDKHNKLLEVDLGIPANKYQEHFEWGMVDKHCDLHNTRVSIEIGYFWN